MACFYAKLLSDLWLGDRGAVSPDEVKRYLSKFRRSFAGFSQMDSVESRAILFSVLYLLSPFYILLIVTSLMFVTVFISFSGVMISGESTTGWYT